MREKLNEAKEFSQSDERYNINVKYLEKVQPKDLTAGEISVRLGATWIPKEIIEDFIFELLDTPRYMRWNIKVHYSEYTGEWNIEGKNNDRGNVSAYSTYGTARANAYVTLMKISKIDWKRESFLSLAGVYRPKLDGTSKVPVSLSNVLTENSNIKLLRLHFDNDIAGKTASNVVATLLSTQVGSVRGVVISLTALKLTSPGSYERLLNDFLKSGRKKGKLYFETHCVNRGYIQGEPMYDYVVDKAYVK